MDPHRSPSDGCGDDSANRSESPNTGAASARDPGERADRVLTATEAEERDPQHLLESRECRRSSGERITMLLQQQCDPIGPQCLVATDSGLVGFMGAVDPHADVVHAHEPRHLGETDQHVGMLSPDEPRIVPTDPSHQGRGDDVRVEERSYPHPLEQLGEPVASEGPLGRRDHGRPLAQSAHGHDPGDRDHILV